MGCGASKEAANAVVSEKPPVFSKGASSGTNGTAATTTDGAPSTPTKPTNKKPAPPKANSVGGSLSNIMAAGSGRSAWAIRPGYSSGASSYSGSEMSREDAGELAKFDMTGLGEFNVSTHSDILALGTLRQEMMADGDLAKAVVRIETPFDTPIEEIYNGVLDGPVLGSGVSGIVRLVTHRATGVKYAVKCLDLGLIDTTQGLRQLRDEIFIMCQLDHPNIVRIEEVYESSNEIYIVQELCVGGDLFDRLDEQPDYHYTEAQCAKLVKQMLSALRYIHKQGIIHRDLKLENFLFSSDRPDSELKMIDFGLSKHFEVGQHLYDKVGTPYTVAPEIIKGSYDEKSDLWALGVITYLLLSGETPFGGLDGESLMLVKENIMRAQVKFEPAEAWQNVSKEGKAFIMKLLDPDPAKRPNAKETQKSEWIQVWAKKDAEEGAQLNKNTVTALIAFKESSDMQKLLSEVLSFTLMPEQMEDLRREFEIMDDNGDGEISLKSLKKVLMENAEAGSLGALTEKEVEEIFDSIRLRKSEPTIRWHEFLAAGLSQARVDDRNLRLAFGRLDTQHKGFITFDDLVDILGCGTENEALERIWIESLEECKAHLDRITFEDFKKLMKGQPKEIAGTSVCSLAASVSETNSLRGASLSSVPEGIVPAVAREEILNSIDTPSGMLLDDSLENPRMFYGKGRSHSYEQKGGSWDAAELSDHFAKPELTKESSLALVLPSHRDPDIEEITNDSSMTPIAANRALYRKHREMRLAVLEASKQFDKKRNDIQNRSHQTHAGLIMKRGVKPPVEVEDAHARALFDSAAKRCGRSRRAKNRTVSDVTGMMSTKA